ncbi:hypothetical protein GQ600_11446 [Phytophthora cactorum]|nr:hypothetical protein GQ600_11446 [Phytophthora cactorum]
MDGGGLGDDIGNDDDGDAGGLGGIGDIGALRGLSDELVDDGTAANDNDEIVVAGRAVARGGAVVARPGLVAGTTDFRKECHGRWTCGGA